MGEASLGDSYSNESACNMGDLGSIPGLGRSPREGHGNPLQYPFQDNPIDRGAWRARVHRVVKESDTTEHAHAHTHMKLEWD